MKRNKQNVPQEHEILNGKKVTEWPTQRLKCSFINKQYLVTGFKRFPEYSHAPLMNKYMFWEMHH